MKVMLIDHDKRSRDDHRAMLGKLGYDDVIEAVEGKDAMSKVFGANPELIVVEHDMPGMSGVMFVKTYHARGGQAPILMMDDKADRKKVVEVLRSVGLDNWQPTDHVAIDRWTSGVTDSKLFSVLEPHGVMWDPLKIDIDVSRLKVVGIDPLVAVAAVLFAFQQLHSGAVGLGWGTHRGHGSVAVTAISIHGLPETETFSLGLVNPKVDLISQIESSNGLVVDSLRIAWSREVAS